MPLFALVDCDNFFVSCERVFNPKLERRPVVVLSNNDGCIVARSAEVKALGVKMGAPYFMAREFLEKHGTVVLSSNYELYSDMSRRVMTILSRFAPEVEVYSVDEAFLGFDGFAPGGLEARGREIVATVAQWTGIPTRVGVSVTKTLAKLANKMAKKSVGAGGVRILLTTDVIDEALRKTEVGDVWGVGPAMSEKLAAAGVRSAWDFVRKDDEWIRRRFGVTALRTAMELRGTSCFSLDSAPAPRKSVCHSRSFGEPVFELEGMREAVATYAAEAAGSLRDEGSLAGCVMVFITTGHFESNRPRHHDSVLVPLPSPTNYPADIVACALRGLGRIYRKGFGYKKAGVVLLELTSSEAVQMNLFAAACDQRKESLAETMRLVKAKFGKNALRFAVEGVEKPWAMRRGMRSKSYTSDWDGVPSAR